MATSITQATGQQMVTLGSAHVGESYIFGAMVPKNKSGWRGPWDCAEFVAWLIFQTSGRLYGCQRDDMNPAAADAFTGFFERDATNLGRKISVNAAAAIPGAFLFRMATRILPVGHIVVSDGTGGTVEAHSRVDGVIRGKVANRRWDFGILVPWIRYEERDGIVIPKPKKEVFRVMSPLMESPVIGDIQRALIAKGFDPRGVDNKYGNNTAKAVIAFQETNGLLVDGEVGEQTAAALGVELPQA